MRVFAIAVALVLAGCSGGPNGQKFRPEAVDSSPRSSADAPAAAPVKTDPEAEAKAAAKAAATALAKMPQCSSIWIVGKKLPAGYGGCKEGETVGRSAQFCTAVVAYESSSGMGYFTDKRRTIHGGVKDFVDDPEFGKLLAKDC